MNLTKITNRVPYLLLIAIPGILSGVTILQFFSVLIVAAATFLLVHKQQNGDNKQDQPQNAATSDPESNNLIKDAHADIEEDDCSLGISALGSQYIRRKWQESEGVIDEILDQFIMLVNSKIDSNTIAVLFPTNDNGYFLRRYHSKCNGINKGAVIYPGVGILGTFFKEGLKPLKLNDIPNSSVTLYYYTHDVGVRSLMASPIIAKGIERGAIVIDSKNKSNFTEEDHAFLNTAAALLGNSVYNAYLYTKYRLEHRRFRAVNEIEQELLSCAELDNILDRITETIPYAIPCDRLTISMKNDNDSSLGSIVRATGAQSERFLGASFEIDSKNLASILYSKNISFFRNYAPDNHEIRYFKGEPKNDDLKSFLAVPFGVTDSKGMILVESCRKDAFAESNQELISRLAISTGVAIGRYQTLEKTKTLATHDGLTGLYNHRQFQSILSSVGLRSTRCNDPFILVLCDIDYFKKLNDNYGHPFGDIVLKGIASKLGSSIREEVDYAARYGGEEFVLILYKTDDTGALETVERIRQAIASEAFTAPNGKTVNVTMSFGIAQYGKHAKQTDELIKKADKALYRAKSNGRNRIEIFSV